MAADEIEAVSNAWSAAVDCPVLGTIDRGRCLDEQAQKYSSANRTRVQLFRACRSGCPHSSVVQKSSNPERLKS